METCGLEAYLRRVWAGEKLRWVVRAGVEIRLVRVGGVDVSEIGATKRVVRWARGLGGGGVLKSF